MNISNGMKSDSKAHKAQGAMEYVINYGWAIIVLMIIGVTMWYLGVFNLGKTVEVPIVSGFSSIKPLADNIIFTTDGDFAGIFVNGAGSYIEVTGISIVNSDGTTCHGEIIGSNEVPTGEEFIVGGTACSSGSHEVGDRYSINMSIDYTTKLGSASIPHTERGFISGRYGGSIAGIIPADDSEIACASVGGVWFATVGDYCSGGDDCAVHPKCCGDDPEEYYKSSPSIACCKQVTSCSSNTGANEHECWIHGTLGGTGHYIGNNYICDSGVWHECTPSDNCTKIGTYYCNNATGTWEWMTKPPALC